MSKLKTDLCNVDMNDPQALNKMLTIVNEAMYKYEPIESMTVGQVVDEHYYKSTQFYIITKNQRVDFEKFCVCTLSNWIDRGEVGRKVLISVDDLKDL